MNIIKRNGEEQVFNPQKISIAISKANVTVPENEQLSEEAIVLVTEKVTSLCEKLNRAVSVEEIQDFVEKEIDNAGYFSVAKNYITYRYERSLARRKNTTDASIMSIVDRKNEEINQENSNKNPVIISTMRDYMAGEVSKDISNRYILDDDIKEAHEIGIIHFHDLDYYINNTFNCCLINLGDMLQNGTCISGTHIDKPHRFSTACNIATQIIAQVASNQYGGQSISLGHLAPFVEDSRRAIRKEVQEEFDILGITSDKIDEIVEKRLKKEIAAGVQTIQYQVITLMTTNGQAPFLTVFCYLNEIKDPKTKADLALIIEEVLLQRIKGVKNEVGVYVTPAFPKIVYTLEEDNIRPDSKYWYLTVLAAKCTAKRLVPDYVSEKKMLEYKVDKNGEGHCYTPMGCRSFLTPYIDENGNPKYYGRFNQGVVTINLPDVALTAVANVSSRKDNSDILEEFWKIFNERMEMCHRGLKQRHERLEKQTSDISPIHWQYGALARLKKGESISKLLHGGYSTISLGYAGLWECVYGLIKKKLTEPEGKELGLAIMKKLNEYTAKWKAAEHIDYSIYGTPIESTTYKFAKCLQKRFGVVEGVSDKNYITNSYHVKVTEPIDAFSKLALEAEFQRLSPGGAISYVEVPNMQNNIPAVLEVIKFIYDNIMYAELNTKSDYCQVCGFDGEIQIVKDENGKFIWECPNCKNHDHNKMNVARRVCGYISTNDMNQGRIHEVKERKLHL